MALVSYSDMKVKVIFKVNQIKHAKGETKSFQFRYIRSPEKEKNKPEFTRDSTPGKEWLRNLKDTPFTTPFL